MSGVVYGTGRQALLDATIHIVAERGMRGLTYRAVAAEAGVTQGLVRHHFGDRDTLIQQAAEYAAQASVQTAGFETETPGLRKLSRQLVDVVAAREDIQVFQYELALEARRRPELLPVLNGVYDMYRAAMRRELARNHIVDNSLAAALFAALDGIVFQLVAFGDRDAAARSLTALRALVLAPSGSGPAVANDGASPDETA